ncbi:hypothetical protein ASG25_20640 [Rhizobium sp. Leaf384]|uniref:TniQ family protein n=1 Tax=Rhizobium sp. Leaf384 TaxID=1736358 RepID=UPI000714268F|nr:TniQ family protein [Rhizobium sp. Leaf384]KQS75170.1 hypothetical protein ASG25_20640 [Rhizobium sp. Leaf384]
MSSTIATFTLVPPVREYETPASFVSRLSAYNCLSSVADLYRLAGAKSGRRPASSGQRYLLEMAGLTESDFREAVSARPNFVMLNGHDISVRHLSRQLPRYCPLCVTEDIARGAGPVGARSYQRFWWQWTLIGTCNRHGCRLVTGEKENARSLPDFARYVSDNAGKIRSEAEGSTGTGIDAFDRYLLDRLMARLDLVTGVLERVPLYVAVNFCEQLGHFLENDYRFERAPRQENHFVRAGFALISKGEAAMFRCIEQRASIPTRTGTVSKSRRYGPLYNLLSIHVGDPNWQPLLDIFQRDAFGALRLADGEEFLGAVYTSPFDSIDSISLRYDVPPSYVARVLGESGFIPDPAKDAPGGRPSTARITPEELERLFGWVRSAHLTAAASASLGLDRYQLVDFGTAGFLRFVGHETASGKRRFCHASIESLLGDISALDSVPRVGHDYRSLLDAQEWPGLKPVDLWAGIRAGRVRAVRRRNVSGFRGVYVSRQDMLDMLPAPGAQEQDAEELSMNVLPQHEVMKHLRLRAATVRRLLEIGVLTGFAASGRAFNGPRFYYHRAKVDEFSTFYASLPSLAYEARVSPAKLRSILDRSDVSQMFQTDANPKKGAGETRIYWRAECREIVARVAREKDSRRRS